MAKIAAEEIRRGLVARLDPAVLLENGASADPDGKSAVCGVHFFVCISRGWGVSVWVPAFSRWLDGRIQLRYKAGVAAWVEPDSFIDLMQHWMIPDVAVDRASALTELTTRHTRNSASLFFLLGRHLEPAA